MTATQAIVEALKTLPDPDTAEKKRVLAIARAKMAQNGEKVAISEDRIDQTRYRLREACGRPLTRENLVKYKGGIGTNGKGPGVPVATSKLAQPEPTLTASQLRLAKAFVQAVGGTATAADLVKIVAEMQA